MRTLITRLPVWLHVEKPWLVIVAGTIGRFHTWPEAYQHATRIA